MISNHCSHPLVSVERKKCHSSAPADADCEDMESPRARHRVYLLVLSDLKTSLFRGLHILDSSESTLYRVCRRFSS